jgi:hypothetical protein
VFGLGLALVGLLAFAAPSGSATRDPDVGAGLEAYRQLDFDRAVVTLGRALVRPDLSDFDRISALETLGFAYLILDDRVHAEESFHRLLDLDPAHEIPLASSPRLRSGFAAARASWLERRRIGFELADDPERLIGALRGDLARVGRVLVLDGAGNSEPMTCVARECRAERPSGAFWIEVRDHRGEILLRSGPFGLPAPNPSPSPADDDAASIWPWAALGVGLIGAAIASALILGAQRPAAGTLGRLDLP